jgi:hypothetical protein
VQVDEIVDDYSETHRFLRGKNQAHQPAASVKKPSLHRCKDGGEAYSASYLITREHLIYQNTAYNLTWVNCEMGSFIMMTGRVDPRKNVNGSLLQTIDVLDFSVIHLSAYERLLLRWAKSSPIIGEDRNNLQPVVNSANILKHRYELLENIQPPPEHSAFNRTVVIMPYLGSDMGAGHSKLANRQAYVAACFWSFRAYYPFVVAAVKSVKDYEFLRYHSNLPFYDIIFLSNLPKSASLPVGTVQATKARILSPTGNWSHFDYIFFTESDQILMMRNPDDLYAYLDLNPRHLILPHRLMAYPESVLMAFHHREVSEHLPMDWFDMQCCLPRQHCTERNDWRKVSNDSVSILKIFGLQVPLGNSNFHAETYRYCSLKNSTEQAPCP